MRVGIVGPVLYHCKPTQPFARWSYARRSSSDIKWSRSFLRSGGQKSIENLWISNVYRILLDSCEHMKVIIVSLDLPRVFVQGVVCSSATRSNARTWEASRLQPASVDATGRASALRLRLRVRPDAATTRAAGALVTFAAIITMRQSTRRIAYNTRLT